MISATNVWCHAIIGQSLLLAPQFLHRSDAIRSLALHDISDKRAAISDRGNQNVLECWRQAEASCDMILTQRGFKVTFCYQGTSEAEN